MNQGYLKKIMAEKFNLNRQDGVIIIPNSFDDNHEILEYLNSKNKKDSLSMYFIVASKKNINKNHDFDMSNSIVISTSIPVLETKQNKLYLTAKVSTYYANNWTGMEVYNIVFHADKNGKALRYLSHTKQLKHIIVGPPSYLSDLSDVDSLSLKHKMMRIDSLIKHNLKSIPDSTKVKMGIKIV